MTVSGGNYGTGAVLCQQSRNTGWTIIYDYCSKTKEINGKPQKRALAGSIVQDVMDTFISDPSHSISEILSWGIPYRSPRNTQGITLLPQQNAGENICAYDYGPRVQHGFGLPLWCFRAVLWYTGCTMPPSGFPAIPHSCSIHFLKGSCGTMTRRPIRSEGIRFCSAIWCGAAPDTGKIRDRPADAPGSRSL